MPRTAKASRLSLGEGLAGDDHGELVAAGVLADGNIGPDVHLMLLEAIDPLPKGVKFHLVAVATIEPRLFQEAQFLDFIVHGGFFQNLGIAAGQGFDLA